MKETMVMGWVTPEVAGTLTLVLVVVFGVAFLLFALGWLSGHSRGHSDGYQDGRRAQHYREAQAQRERESGTLEGEQGVQVPRVTLGDQNERPWERRHPGSRR